MCTLPIRHFFPTATVQERYTRIGNCAGDERVPTDNITVTYFPILHQQTERHLEWLTDTVIPIVHTLSIYINHICNTRYRHSSFTNSTIHKTTSFCTNMALLCHVIKSFFFIFCSYHLYWLLQANGSTFNMPRDEYSTNQSSSEEPISTRSQLSRIRILSDCIFSNWRSIWRRRSGTRIWLWNIFFNVTRQTYITIADKYFLNLQSSNFTFIVFFT